MGQLDVSVTREVELLRSVREVLIQPGDPKLANDWAIRTLGEIAERLSAACAVARFSVIQRRSDEQKGGTGSEGLPEIAPPAPSNAV